MNGSEIVSDTPPTSSFNINSKNGDSEAVLNSSYHLGMTNEESIVQYSTSDLREQTSPVGDEQVKQIKQLKQQQDLAHDPELANGLTNGSSVSIQRTLSSGLKQSIADEDAMDISTAHDISKVEDSIGVVTSVSTDTAFHMSDLPDQPIISNLDGSVDDTQGESAPTPTAVGSALNDLAIDSTTKIISSSPQPEHASQGFSRSSSKLTRNREDEEGEEGPATKRTRTDDEGSQAPEFKIPDLPRTMTEANEDGTDTAQSGNTVLQDRSLPMTKSQNKFLLKGLQNIRRLKDATAFNHPVDYVALNIPTYPDVIKQPMDLKTMEEKMKKEKYLSVDGYIADFDQVVQNSLNFNGVTHPVSVCARSIRGALDKQLSNLPGPDVAEPSPATKKSKKGPTPKANIPARRESRSSIGNAKSPTATSSPQTFALGPQGVPLIRRDSTVTDGRPKREIHPPAPRDLPYANQKPKKKKFQLELRFCQEVLNEIKGKKYSNTNFAFMSPVDPVALNIPHYHKIIKKPMDLSTIEKNLAGGQYENAKEFEGDVRLMFSNCYKFNPPTDAVHAMGKDLEGVFDAFWARKKQWIDEHAPALGPQSPRSSPEVDDDDEEDDEEEEDQDEPDGAITAMEKKIADMAKAVEQMKKKKSSPPVPTKKLMKGGKAAKKDVKRSSVPAPAKAEKKGASKPSKVKKIPIVTYDQKQDISNRINSLPENRMANALTIIRDNMPNLKVVQIL